MNGAIVLVILKDTLLESFVDDMLVFLQDFNQVQKVFGYFQVLVDHILNLFLDDLIHFVCMQGVRIFTSKHQLQGLQSHDSLLLEFFFRQGSYRLIQIPLRPSQVFRTTVSTG